MILINKAFLKIWKVETKEKYVVANTSSGDKQQDGTYKNSNWSVRFVGKCFESAKGLEEGDSIIVKSAKIENIWDKQKERNWLNLIVFDFEEQGAKEDSGFYPVDDGEDDLPF